MEQAQEYTTKAQDYDFPGEPLLGETENWELIALRSQKEALRLTLFVANAWLEQGNIGQAQDILQKGLLRIT